MITWKFFMDIVNNLAGLYLVCWYSVEDCLQVDMESLLVTGKLSVLMVGQDVLSATNEVGSNE